MRKILALLTTLTSVPIVGTTTVACGQKETERLNNNISKEIGLVDENNNGTISATIINDKNQAEWAVDNSRLNINAGYLLNSEDKQGYATAKSKNAYDFLKNTLKIEPVSGSYFTDALFDRTTASEITVKLIPNSIRVTVKPTVNKKDFYIASGSYEIQFIRGIDVLTSPYSVALKTDDKNISQGLITRVLQRYSTLDFNSYKIPGFKIGAPTWKPEVGENISKYLDFFNSFIKLINQTGLKIIITDKTTANEFWQVNDSLKLQITMNGINNTFSYNLTVQKLHLEYITQKDFNMKLNWRNFIDKDYSSLSFADFNSYSSVFLENNIGSSATFQYSDSPFQYNDISKNQIRSYTNVYVQITINYNFSDPCWTGTSQWLQIKITDY